MDDSFEGILGKAVRRRKMPTRLTVTYHAKRPLSSSLRWSGSLIQQIVKSFDFWFFISLSVVLNLIEVMCAGGRCGADAVISSEEGVVPDYDINKSLGVSQQLIIFLLLFFNEYCFVSYLDQYYLTNTITLTLDKVAVLMRVHLNDKDSTAAIAIVRYMHAAHHLLYYEMHGKKFYTFLQAEGMLTPGEIHRCQENAGESWLLVLSWALREMRMQYDQENIDVYAYRQMERLGSSMMKAGTMLLANELMPPPFPYFQFLQFFLYMYLLIQAYAFHSIQPTYLGIASSSFTIIILLGLRNMGSLFIEPFGSDDNDLKVPLILQLALTNGKALLDDEWFPPEASMHKDFLQSTMQLAGLNKRHSIVLAMTQDKDSAIAYISDRALEERVQAAENTEAARALRSQHEVRLKHQEELYAIGRMRRRSNKASVLGAARAVGSRMKGLARRLSRRTSSSSGVWPGQAKVRVKEGEKYVFQQDAATRTKRAKERKLAIARAEKERKKRMLRKVGGGRPDVSVFDTIITLLDPGNVGGAEEREAERAAERAERLNTGQSARSMAFNPREGGQFSGGDRGDGGDGGDGRGGAGYGGGDGGGEFDGRGCSGGGGSRGGSGATIQPGVPQGREKRVGFASSFDPTTGPPPGLIGSLPYE